jgi:hypothetical protein
MEEILDSILHSSYVLGMIRRRLGPPPHAAGARTPALEGCPDIFELESGEFALIGRDITAEARGQLPSDASCGPDERIIALPRKTLVLAKRDIPDTL